MPPLFPSRSHLPLTSARATTVRTWRSPRPPLSLHLSLILIPASLLSLCAHAVRPRTDAGTSPLASQQPHRPHRTSCTSARPWTSRNKRTDVAQLPRARTAVPLILPLHAVPSMIPRRNGLADPVHSRARGKCTHTWPVRLRAVPRTSCPARAIFTSPCRRRCARRFRTDVCGALHAPSFSTSSHRPSSSPCPSSSLLPSFPPPHSILVHCTFASTASRAHAVSLRACAAFRAECRTHAIMSRNSRRMQRARERAG
ncbi:hypothetical protein B0H16DRAFT_826079 [Mycena metata]|uniref:Uncharacterized protein n=1 Tax=Mycena metata TaxID=1033252 RepID=A0AAD7DQF9_9AGAR|nr:hypothetical protein B0H16DRAFT_826079 [Mycena metata]